MPGTLISNVFIICISILSRSTEGNDPTFPAPGVGLGPWDLWDRPRQASPPRLGWLVCVFFFCVIRPVK